MQYIHRIDRRNAALVCKKWHYAARSPHFFGILRLHQELHPHKIKLPEFYNDILPFKKIIFEYVYPDDIKEDDYSEFWEGVDHGISHAVFEGCTCLTTEVFEKLIRHFPVIDTLEIERKQSLGDVPLNVKFEYLRQLRLENVFMNLKQIMTLIDASPNLTLVSVSDNLKDRFFEFPYPSMYGYVVKLLEKVDTVELHMHNYYEYDIELMQKVERLLPGLKIGFFRIPRTNLADEKTMKEILRFLKVVKTVSLVDICVISDVKELLDILDCLEQIPKLELELDFSLNLSILHKHIKGKGTTMLANKTIGACYYIDDILFDLVQRIYWIGTLFPLTLDALTEACPALQELDVSGVTGMNDERIQIIFVNCPRLKKLNISSCTGLTEEGITGWKRLPPEEEGGQSTVTFTGHLIKNLTELEVLIANQCSQSITDRALATCFKFRYLTELQIYSANKITNKGLDFLAQNCPHLEKLGLIGCEKLNPDCIAIITLHLRYLKTLLLPKNDEFLFTDPYFRSLSYIRELNYKAPRV